MLGEIGGELGSTLEPPVQFSLLVSFDHIGVYQQESPRKKSSEVLRYLLTSYLAYLTYFVLHVTDNPSLRYIDTVGLRPHLM